MERSKNPTRYESHDGKIAIKLDMQTGDMGLVAIAAPPNTRGVMVFVYDDESVTIIGTEPKQETIELFQKAIRSIAPVPAQHIPS